MTQEQAELLKLFQVFTDICEKNGLRYYLIGGTLLGAVRHRGFIPWDDDIDVMMLSEDYDRFLRLEGTLPPNLRLVTEHNSGTYPFYFCELCDLSVPFQSGRSNGPPGIFLDVFPLLPSRDPSLLTKFIFNIISVIGFVMQVKCGWTDYIPYKKLYARIGYRLLDLYSIPTLRTLRRALISMLAKDGGEYCFSPGGGHKGNTEFYRQRWFSAYTEVEFENNSVRAPIGWHECLTQLYGDYMTLPPEAERVSHHKHY